MNNKSNKKQLKEYFLSLGLTKWVISGDISSGGQADIIEVKNNTTSELGVFRTLRRRDEKDVARFYRELKILTKTNHPNIVKILDYTKDNFHQWYIGKKGVPFEEHWKDFFNKHHDDPDFILEEAVRILLKLTEGLIDLHKQKVVHRDIKAKNIILNGNEPVLIDFGVAFVTGEERLTPVDDAVANMYSPDPALNFMENVPPWLDIFLLSQLLIWMASENTNKPNIQRPLDWRWVVYPKFSDLNLFGVRALTAKCSNYFTSPKNATELKVLINKLFGNKAVSVDSEDSFKINKVKEVARKGISSQIINFSNAHELIEVRLPSFVSICTELELGIKDMIAKLSNDFRIESNERKFILDFIKNFEDNTQTELRSTYQTIFNYTVGEDSNTFAFGFSYLLYTRQGIINSPQFKPFENMPIIAFTIGSNEKLNRKGKTKSYYIIPYDNGALKLQDGNTLQLIKEVTITEVIGLVKDSIVDPDVWKIIYS